MNEHMLLTVDRARMRARRRSRPHRRTCQRVSARCHGRDAEELRLSRGTGAAVVVPFLRAAAVVVREMTTLVSAGENAAERGI